MHVFHGGTLTDTRFRDKILDQYVNPYTAAIGNDLILMGDNVRFHRALLVKDYFEGHGFERMEWPVQYSDLNPIEIVWDYLVRYFAALSPFPKFLHDLE